MSRRIHLVGIGGAGLSAIARVLHERGESVSGSDLKPSVFSDALLEAGIQVTYGHRAENIAGAELVLVSSAIPADNPEIQAARQASVPVVRRSEFLGDLTSGMKTIAIAGTHGKTTTTALIAWVLNHAGLSPGFVVGGIVRDLETNARAGSGSLFVIEADEYDRAFLGLRPSIGVVTNVEHDHPDEFPTPEDFQAAFAAFVGQVQDVLIYCEDDPGARALETPGMRRVSYGLEREADWHAEEIRVNQAGGSDFLVLRGGEVKGLVRTRLPGTHNVNNTLASLAVSSELGVPFNEARAAITSFRGVARRFEVVGEVAGVTVVDDYAHHPSEIRATLEAARQRFPDRALWSVFQPHTFSRMRVFLPQLKDAFEAADHVLVTEVFAAREEPDPSVSGEKLAQQLNHPDVRFAAGIEQAAQLLVDHVGPDEVVVTLSAGDGNRIGWELLERLKVRERGHGNGKDGKAVVRT